MDEVRRAIADLLRELFDGPPSAAAYILNPGDPGLLRSLDRLPAAAASAAPPAGGPSIAAHVDHVRYGLTLLNRWSRGENPFADADYAASWRGTRVTEPEWAALRAALREEAERWRAAVEQPRELDDVALRGIIGSVAHTAYHLAAIRQIDRAARGPAAQD